MTQIEPTNADIAEALRQMGRPERIIDAALKIGAFTQAELNFARTIAKLRVAREALEKISNHNSEDIYAKLVSEIALAQTTQETPNAG